MFAHFNRTAAAAGLAVAALTPPAAFADASAEAFVAENAGTVLEILGDDALSTADKAAQFRALIDDIADVPRVTRYVLGRYARTVSADDFTDFAAAFREYAIGVYETRLGEYGGETLEVTGSTDVRGARDVIVDTEVTGGSRDEPLEVRWRVMGGPDNHRVVDVEVYGVWLAVNQQQEMVSIIGANGGRVSAATDALRERVEAGDFATGDG